MQYKVHPPEQIVVFNTLGRAEQQFNPLIADKIKMYNCGPTVYDYAHIGNLRAFTFADTLRRVFTLWGFDVTQVMNITDVGHLTSDDDFGDDKMLKALARERATQGKDLTVWDVAQFYIDAFVADLSRMNIMFPTHMPRATDNIQEMIGIIEALIDKGYAYVTKKAVYFDVTKDKEYTKLFPQALDEKVVGARSEVITDPDKKHPADFRLWQLDQPQHAMLWDSPWGKGFPGWHIECSAMSIKYLGETFDIHTGGIDHIPVHHTNEIAQSECATGKTFSNYWMHVEFLKVNNEKMSKSKGNFYALQDIVDKGFSPLHLRYFYLMAHYRSVLNFTWEALEAAKNAYEGLKEIYEINRALALYSLADKYPPEQQLVVFENHLQEITEAEQEQIKNFTNALANDFNTPIALKELWELAKNQEISPLIKTKLLLIVNDALGLGFEKNITSLETLLKEKKFGQYHDIKDKIVNREVAKQNKNWQEADKIRNELLALGYKIIDTPKGPALLNS